MKKRKLGKSGLDVVSQRKQELAGVTLRNCCVKNNRGRGRQARLRPCLASSDHEAVFCERDLIARAKEMKLLLQKADRRNYLDLEDCGKGMCSNDTPE